MMRFAKQYLLARRTLLMAAVLATASCALWAQSDQPGGDMHRSGPNIERELGQLTQALTLTADQQTQVKALRVEHNQPASRWKASAKTPTAKSQPC